MIFTGMIYQYNSEEGCGLIMLSNGENREFQVAEWVDAENRPAIGQKIAYESSAEDIKIWLATQEDIKRALEEQESCHGEREDELKSLEEHLKHFLAKGFKQVTETTIKGIQTVILRSFIDGEAHEITLIKEEFKTSIIKKVNGKVVT